MSISIYEQVSRFQEVAKGIQAEVAKVIVGQEEVVRGTLIAIIAGGHVLLEGVPGLGKTLLVRTFADVLGLSYGRVQFTSDLMPADITGTHIISDDGRGQRYFRFERGPIFANLVLADEINRATPKTQAALLEAMQEGTVTAASTAYSLPKPFLVIATQNPLEMEGTYPLPEAQLDRFFFKLVSRFPSSAELMEIVDRTTSGALPRGSKVAEAESLLEMSGLARQVPIAHHVANYAINLVLATHPHHPLAPRLVRRFVRYGASPRGVQALVLAGKVSALLEGRYNVAFKDIRSMAPGALRHRLILNFEAEAEQVGAEALIGEVVQSLPEES